MRKVNIPAQLRGKKMDFSVRKSYNSSEEVIEAFHAARTRLLDINNWHVIAGSASATFKLVNLLGTTVAQYPKKGQYVKIDIPGPGSFIGGGYDWARITQLNDYPMDNYIQITLQPATPPKKMAANETAHFFKATSSTNIEVKIVDHILYVNYYGRNEETNLQSKRFLENIRNAMVGFGAKLGLSYPQWKKIIQGILG